MQSTLTESTETTSTQWCMVYDKRTGKVVHIHQFIALTANDLCSRENLERMAIAMLSPEWRSGTEDLGIFHPGTATNLDPSMNYTINLESHLLVEERDELFAQTREGVKKNSGK